MELTHPKYREDIDGLRAIAVLSVVGFHAFPNWITGGFVGVDIFFIISGFLISTIIFGSLSRNSFSFVQFYARRIKRIYPALLLVLAASYAFGWFALLADEYKQLGKHIAAGAGFVANLVLWNEVGYFDNEAETKPLLHLWSLGIEEQFYIVWPFFLWLGWTLRLNLLTLTLIVALISFVLNIDTVGKDATADFYSPQTRFWELLIGSILAYVNLFKPHLMAGFRQKLDKGLGVIIYAEPPVADGRTLRNCLSIAGALLIALGILFINRQYPFPGWWALLPTLGTVLIIAADRHAWLNRTLLSNRVLVWFGLISFPLYLWHWPLLSFARILESGPPSETIQAYAVLISIILAWLTYQCVEKPLRFGVFAKVKLSPLVLFIAIAVLGGIGYRCYINNGFIQRFKNEVANHNRAYKVAPSIPCDTLFPLLKDMQSCGISKPESPSVVLIGDSHSGYVYNRLATSLSDQSVMWIVGKSCLPFSSGMFLANPECRESFKTALTFLKKQESIKTVYLVGYWNYLIGGSFTRRGDGWRIPEAITEKDSASFKKNAEWFIRGLMAGHKEVVFFRDFPDMDFNVRECVRPFALTKTAKNPCAIDEIAYRNRVAAYEAVINSLVAKFPKMKVFDPRSTLCDGQLCWAMKNGQLLYKNGDHLTSYGADLVLKQWLMASSSQSKPK